MQPIRRFLALAVTAAIAIAGLGGVTAGPAAAAVQKRACDGDGFSTEYPLFYAEIRVCVQYDGVHINAVADVVTHAEAVEVEVRVVQCGTTCGTLKPSAVHIVPAGSHEFVPTTLFNAARGHVYHGELWMYRARYSTTDSLSVPCPC